VHYRALLAQCAQHEREIFVRLKVPNIAKEKVILLGSQSGMC
jgi:hypothetical protein